MHSNNRKRDHSPFFGKKILQHHAEFRKKLTSLFQENS